MSEFFIMTIKRASQAGTVCRSHYVDPSQLESSCILLNVPAHNQGFGRQGQESSLYYLKLVLK